MTEMQILALAVLRRQGAQRENGWVGLDAVAEGMGVNRRSAGIVLGKLERLGYVLRWEPTYRNHPLFTALTAPEET